MINDEAHSQIKIKFFQAVKESNATEIVKFFRDDTIKPWEFKEEEDYTGIIILPSPSQSSFLRFNNGSITYV